MEQRKMYQVEERKFSLQVTGQAKKRENIPDNVRANKLWLKRLNYSSKLPARLDHPLHRRRKAVSTSPLSVSSCLNQFGSQSGQLSPLSQAGELINRLTNPRTAELPEQPGGRPGSRATRESPRESSRECPQSAVDHHQRDRPTGEFISRDQSISHDVEINVQNVNRVRDFNGRHPFKLTGHATNGERWSNERVADSIRRSEHIERTKGACEIKKATKTFETTVSKSSETATEISETTCEEDSKTVEDHPQNVQDVNLLYNCGQQHNSYLIKFLCKSSTPINCAAKRNSPFLRLLLLFAFFITAINAAPRVVKIGALFTDDHKDGPSELAFKYAVYRINKDRTILPNTTLIYDIQYTPREDSFHAAKRACLQISNGISAIFGPQDTLLGNHIQSLCDALEIPHLEARLDLEPQIKEVSINLYPNAKLIGQAIRDLINYLNWTQVAVIYEDDISLIKLQSLVNPPMKKSVQFTFRKASVDQFRDTLMDIRTRGIYSMIIDTKNENLPHFLTAILQIQMNNYKYHYHFATFDIENYNLNNFKYNFVNMTAFRIVDSETVNVQSVLDHMRMFEPLGHSSLNTSNVIRHEPALLYDSVYAFAHGVNALLRSASFSPNNISCDQEVAWSEGSSLFNYINSADFSGLTGRVQFKEGQRNLLKLDLLKLRTEKLEKVGEWTSTDGLNIMNHNAFHEFGTQNITLRVTTIETIPYVMIKNGNYTGNQRFEGFCIDLLDAIAINLGFQYELYFVPDGKFGAENTTTGEWNGLVREIIDKNADLAVAAMTINYARESVIDFTKPFMNLGIGILFKLPSTMPTKLFSFMSPLDVNIWLYVLAAYMLVSFTLFVVARFSPYEWHPMHPCVSKQQDMIENQFSLSNCFWFSTVTLMHQGCDLNPKATSTRIIGAIWWFFTLILVSSYTANLAAFLTVERMITPIESVEDLASQSKIQYGTLDSGSTMTFFRDSRIPTYQKMWRYMENRPNLFVTSYEEGKSRVLEGNFAFLMESTMLDYMVQRDCNLMQIGGLLDSKGYGIGAPKGSPWRDKISLMILDLQEKGVIQLLYNKWWKNPASCIREDKNKEGKANALGVDNIGGVFVVLLAGLVIAILVAFIEFLCNHKRSDYLQRQSLCSAMGEELRFAIKCRASKQRPRLRRNCSNCLDEKEAFVGDTSGLSTLDAFNRKTRSCLNINQEQDAAGNTFAGVPTSLEMLSSNSNLFHAGGQVKQPHPMHTPSRRSAGLYHRNVSNAPTAFSKAENEVYPQFSVPKYYRYCSNKNQNQCAQACTCEHYPVDHHS